MSEDLVTIAELRSITSADFVRGILRENGIEAFIPEENTALLRYPPFVVASPMRVQVPKAQAEAAKEILRNAEIDIPPSEAAEDAKPAESVFDVRGLRWLLSLLALAFLAMLIYRLTYGAAG